MGKKGNVKLSQYQAVKARRVVRCGGFRGGGDVLPGIDTGEQLFFYELKFWENGCLMFGCISDTHDTCQGSRIHICTYFCFVEFAFLFWLLVYWICILSLCLFSLMWRQFLGSDKIVSPFKYVSYWSSKRAVTKLRIFVTPLVWLLNFYAKVHKSFNYNAIQFCYLQIPFLILDK
jgi:hypothetical protein